MAEQLLLALDHLGSALRILDEIGAPPHVGAYVELARHHLQDVLADGTVLPTVNQNDLNAEPQ